MLNKKVSANLAFHSLPDDTCRLLATWTIAHLDVRGVFYGDPAMVKAAVFPRRQDITVETVARYLDAIESAPVPEGEHPLMVRFEAAGQQWQWWPGFESEQVGLRADRETTDFPEPPTGNFPRIVEECAENGGIEAGELPAEEKRSLNTSSREVKQNTDGADAPLPTNLDGWIEVVRKGRTEKGGAQAALRLMHAHLYPGRDPPGYAYIAKQAKAVGGPERLAQLMWQSSAYRVTGDVLAYCLAMHKGKAKKEAKDVNRSEQRDRYGEWKG